MMGFWLVPSVLGVAPPSGAEAAEAAAAAVDVLLLLLFLLPIFLLLVFVLAAVLLIVITPDPFSDPFVAAPSVPFFNNAQFDECGPPFTDFDASVAEIPQVAASLNDEL